MYPILMSVCWETSDIMDADVIEGPSNAPISKGSKSVNDGFKVYESGEDSRVGRDNRMKYADNANRVGRAGGVYGTCTEVGTIVLKVPSTETAMTSHYLVHLNKTETFDFTGLFKVYLTNVIDESGIASRIKRHIHRVCDRNCTKLQHNERRCRKLRVNV